MADISAGRRTSLDIFRHLMDAGPLTLYAASAGTRFALGTVHRHFKELEAAGKIRVYVQEAAGRRRRLYGPTFYGIVHFARADGGIRDKIENYFLLWADNPGFQKMLHEEGFDAAAVRRDPRGSGRLFRRYVEYGVAVEDRIESLKNDPGAISHDLFVFMGEMLLISDPRFARRWEYLYKNLPGLRRAIDSNIRNLVDAQRRLRK